MLQWHSDPQRQAALEDWAIERIITIANQVFPHSKATIAELVSLFEASKSFPSPIKLIIDTKLVWQPQNTVICGL